MIWFFWGEGPCLHQGKRERHETGGCCGSQKEGAQSGPSNLPDIRKEKIRKKEKEEIDFFIFCLKMRPFEAIFFVMDTLQLGEKTL